MSDIWVPFERPGYFGRRRDEKIQELNQRFGTDNWRLAHRTNDGSVDFVTACSRYYEQSYFEWFRTRPEEVDFVCSHKEVIDNASSNVTSGRDYTKQEAFSTHIQDIAIRNVIHRLGRDFNRSLDWPGPQILVVRSDSNGYKYSPGVIPFFAPHRITQPSLCPKWAKAGSVEDFWQSNKWIEVR